MAARVKLFTLAVASGTASGVVADVNAAGDIQLSATSSPQSSQSPPPPKRTSSPSSPPSKVRTAGPASQSAKNPKASSKNSLIQTHSILKHKALRTEKNGRNQNGSGNTGPTLAPFVFGKDPEADALINSYCNVNKDHGPIDPPVFNVTQAAVFIRHGARTMSGGDQYSESGRCWAGDEVEYNCDDVDRVNVVNSTPFQLGFQENKKNSYRGTCGQGQLVKKGYDMEGNNGKRLREAYSFLKKGDPKYDASRWHLRADQQMSDRTILSGESLVAGVMGFDSLFSLSEEKAKNPESVPSVKFGLDSDTYTTMYPNAMACPKMAVEMTRLQKTTVWQKKRTDFEKTTGAAIDKALNGAKVVGEKVTLENVYTLFDCLMSHMCPTVVAKNPAIPVGFLENNNALLKETLRAGIHDNFDNYLVTHSPKVSAGPILKDLVDDLQADDKDFLLYSGHDLGPMAPILLAIGADTREDVTWPPFASYLVLELGESNSGGNSASNGSSDNRRARFLYLGKLIRNKFCGGLKKSDANWTEDGSCSRKELLEKIKDELVPSEEDCAVSEEQAAKKPPSDSMDSAGPKKESKDQKKKKKSKSITQTTESQNQLSRSEITAEHIHPIRKTDQGSRPKNVEQLLKEISSLSEKGRKENLDEKQSQKNGQKLLRQKEQKDSEVKSEETESFFF